MPNSTPMIPPLAFKHPEDARLGIEILSIAQLQQRAPIAALSRLARADFYRLISITAGHTCPWIDFEPVQAQARDCLLIKPGQVFRYDFAQAWQGWMVVFRPERLYFSANGLGLGARIDKLPAQSSLSALAFEDLSLALHNMQRDSAEVSDVPTLQSLLQLQLGYLLMRLCLVRESALAPDQGVARVLAHYERFKMHMEQGFSHNHQVQYFADALGLSVKTLNRACLAATGHATKSCINQRITLEAKRLLAHTDAAIQAIAIDLGFDDPTNFVKFFKREAGLTPGQFRLSQTSMGSAA